MKRFVKAFAVILCCMLIGACAKGRETYDGTEMGNLEEQQVDIMGVKYNLYKNGYAEIYSIMNPNCVLSDEVSYDGKQYKVVAFKKKVALTYSSVFENGAGYYEAPEVLDLPDNIEEIGSRQLYGCTSKVIRLPENLKYYAGIGGCTNVEEIEIPVSVEEISMSYLYWNCTNLKRVTFPENCQYRPGDHVFCDCDALESVTLPSGLERIGQNTFRDCDKLSDISLGDGVKEIYAGAFYNLPALTEIVIPDNVIRLESRAFVDCFALKDIYLSDNLSDVPASLFRQNYGLDDMDVSGITIHVKESLVDYTKSLYPTANVVAK